MIYALLVLLLILFIYSFISEKNFFNPLTIFSGIWLVVVFFASLKLYKMIDYSDKSIMIIMVGTIFFFIGFLLMKLFYSKKKKNSSIEKNNELKYNWILIRILLVFAIIINILLSIKVTKLLLSGVSYSYIRGMYYAYRDMEPLIKSGAIFTLFDFSTTAVLTISIPTVVLSYFDKKSDKISTILLSILLLLFVYCSAGRTMILQLLINIVIILFIKYKVINKKTLMKLIAIFFIGIVLILISTFARNHNTKNSVPTLYSYLGSPIPIFSHMVDYVDKENIQLKGYSSFYGLYQYTEKISVLAKHKFKNSDYLDSIIIKPASTWINVFKINNHNYNAFATMYYNLYLDYGFVSVFVISMLYGMFATYFYLRVIETGKARNIVFYIVICIGLIFSFEKFQFSGYYIYSSFILSYIYFKGLKVKNTNKLNEVQKDK